MSWKNWNGDRAIGLVIGWGSAYLLVGAIVNRHDPVMAVSLCITAIAFLAAGVFTPRMEME